MYYVLDMYYDIANEYKITFSLHGTPSHFSTRHYLYLLHIKNVGIL